MKGRVYYNKLIRDGIQEKIKGLGEECEVRVIEDDQEFQQELLKKVFEEAGALSRVRSREEFLDEYVDLLAVVDELKNVLGISEEDVRIAYEKNQKKKGGFNLRHFLHWSEDAEYKSNETPQGVRK